MSFYPAGAEVVSLRRHETSIPWGFRRQGGSDFGTCLFIQKMTMALRHGCLLGAFLLICAAQLSSAHDSSCPKGGGGTCGQPTCEIGTPIPDMTCGKTCPGNYDCKLNCQGAQGVCCQRGYIGIYPSFITVRESYSHALYNYLIPKNRPLDYVITIHFQATTVTVKDVCGKDVVFPPVNTIVSGTQKRIGEPAYAIGCNGIQRNLGAAAYRGTTGPDVNFQIGSPPTDPPASDRFCLLEVSIGSNESPGTNTDISTEEATPFYQRGKPYLLWAICDIPGNNVNRGTVLKPYEQVPSNVPYTKRIAFMVFKQQSGGQTITTADVQRFLAFPDLKACDWCRFDVKSFMATYGLEVKGVLNVRAAPDAYGLAQVRGLGLINTKQMCGMYNEISEQNAPFEDGSQY